MDWAAMTVNRQLTVGRAGAAIAAVGQVSRTVNRPTSSVSSILPRAAHAIPLRSAADEDARST